MRYVSFVIALSFFLATQAFADGISVPAEPPKMQNWKLIYSSKEKANDKSGFAILKAKYPNAFKDVEEKTLMSANHETYIYEYNGPHTCTPQDPKLQFTSTSYGACHQADNVPPATDDVVIGGFCFQTGQSIPFDTDPCS